MQALDFLTCITVDNQEIENGLNRIESGKKNQTGGKRPTMAIRFFCIIIFSSLVGIPIQILSFLLALPSH